MGETTVQVEVWAVACDDLGLWLLGEDALRPRLAVGADSDPHAEVELLLTQAGLDLGGQHLAAVHSTSWRSEGPSVVLTYIAAVDCPGPILEHWPDAQPISLGLALHVGKPPAHGATEAPQPRHIDVLYHGLRHLRYLLDTDARVGRALGPDWWRHLGDLAPALAEMYQDGDYEHPAQAA